MSELLIMLLSSLMRWSFVEHVEPLGGRLRLLLLFTLPLLVQFVAPGTLLDWTGTVVDHVTASSDLNIFTLRGRRELHVHLENFETSVISALLHIFRKYHVTFDHFLKLIDVDV